MHPRRTAALPFSCSLALCLLPFYYLPMPRVSILTRTVNRPQLLARTLDSLFGQTFTDWECLIINGGGAAEVDSVVSPRATALAGRVRVLPFESTKPGMRGVPLNFGIQNTTGELITVLDDDDTWDPAFLEKMVGALDRAPVPSIGGIVCQTQVIEETSVEDGLKPVRDYVLNPDLLNATLARLAIVNAWCIHAFLYRRSALEKCGAYAEDLPVLEDWEFNLRFLRHADVLVLPIVLTNYHQRPAVHSGSQANSLHGELDLHKFYESKVINNALRQDLDTGKPGLGQLLASATHTRFLDRRLHQIESKLKSAADKIGKIDSRTKDLKDGRR